MTRKSSPKITMRDVASKAGVSVATVSRYINGTAPVSDKVAEHLDQVLADLNYVPHAVARNLATQKTMAVGLLLTNMYNDFFAPLLYGVESVVGQRRYNLLVATCRAGDHQGNTLPVGPHNTDGMLVFSNSLGEKDLAQLYSMNFPMALIHFTPPPHLPFPCVTVENKAATNKLVSHLIEEHNRCRIIFMRGPENNEDSYWREIGYRAALEAHGIDFDPALILSGGFERQIAYQAIKNLIAKDEQVEFDAIFTGDDDAAIGVITALEESGFRIPEDIAVVGFDDSRLSPFLSPPLTTVRAPTEEVGRIAAQNLFKLLEGQPVEDVTLLPTEIVLRASCGCSE